MQQYDVTLKLLLRGPARGLIFALTGTSIGQWLNVELPKVQNLRLDLLGEAANGDLIQFEIQGQHDPDMALRMADYSFGTRRLCGQFPIQFLLYVGEAPMRMEA